tara:strand:+ start:276 stop:602 length:327 start_codon:yes stop_codon:yes gene_type:complete
MNSIDEIDVLKLKHKIDHNEKFTIIDVRELSEIAICKIKNAIHIPMMEIPNKINDLNKNKEFIIQCKSGSRSARVCEFLAHQGFINVKNLKGGILEWIKLIDPSQSSY